VRGRCHLVHALAPPGASAREANDALNEYVAERAMLADPGPLAGWRLSIHPLTFSLTAVGFAAQTSFTLEQYRCLGLEELAAQEPDDSRFWWRRNQ
jgi:hypothetical protein